MGWKVNDSLSRLPPSLVKQISDVCFNSPNIMTGIDSLFRIPEGDQKFSFICVMPNLAAVVDSVKEYETPIVSQDCIPLVGFSRYKMERCEGELSMKQGFGDEEPTDFEFNFHWRLTADANKLREKIISKFPSLDMRTEEGEIAPIYCLVSLKNDYCDIIGVFQKGDPRWNDTNDIPAIEEAISLICCSIHDTVSQSSRFRVIVQSSIADKLKDSRISIPKIFLRKKGGSLEDPMVICFSSRVEKELGLVENSEFCIFRDDDFLWVTITAPGMSSSMIRLPFSIMTNSQDKITTKGIENALSNSMALKRDKTGVSYEVMKRRLSEGKMNGEEIFSRVGMGVRLATMNAHFEGGKGRSETDFKIEINKVNALGFYKLVPIMLNLCLARLDPDFRSEIKRIPESKKHKEKNSQKFASPRSRALLIWGSDKIRYLTGSSVSSSISRHWVSPHPRQIALTNPKTISEYRSLKRPIYSIDGTTFGMRMIGGHYRGKGRTSNWDGTYTFGKRPSYYSRIAIRWLDHVSKENNIQIIHAEKGGEWRIPINGGHIQFDGYCEETNTVYEFHGDVYHGNPRRFQPDENCHPFTDETAGELYEKTMQREEEIRARGFNLVTMWEDDWRRFEEELAEIKQ